MNKKIIGTMGLLVLSLAAYFFVGRTSDTDYQLPVEQDPKIQTESMTVQESEESPEPAETAINKPPNLQKLCKVWGFTKYTHKAFLTGEKDWDEELLALIPLVQSVTEDEVNDILYNWFIGLGDDGYEDCEPQKIYAWAKSIVWKDLPIDELEEKTTEILDFEQWAIETPWIYIIDRGQVDFQYCILLEIDEAYWEAAESKTEEYTWLDSFVQTSLEEPNKHQMAETDWIHDKSYLGENLSNALSKFNGIKLSERTKAPVFFNQYGRLDFSNEKTHAVNFQNAEYRLLGLFRLWNVMEYYFPYRDILDDDWNELLYDSIYGMLEGNDRQSYIATLVALASKLHDGHIVFTSLDRNYVYYNQFGSQIAPVVLAQGEGHIFVKKVFEEHKENCLLLPGDIILRVNGIDAFEAVDNLLQYISYPNDEKSLDILLRNQTILVQKSSESLMEIDIIRDNTELKLYIETVNDESTRENSYYLNCNLTNSLLISHEILENNIGLINPAALSAYSIDRIMEEFRETDGLIVDLRQYPKKNLIHPLAQYIVKDNQPFAVFARSSRSNPGTFEDKRPQYSGGQSINTYYYDKKVVLLMNESSMSQPETTVMSLRNGENVTVIGRNSFGANGDVVTLSLPGRVTMNFSSIGCYTIDGGQTQRIGLSPDIYVENTIEGIMEGRDEIMEAAISYILE